MVSKKGAKKLKKAKALRNTKPLSAMAFSKIKFTSS